MLPILYCLTLNRFIKTPKKKRKRVERKGHQVFKVDVVS